MMFGSLVNCPLQSKVDGSVFSELFLHNNSLIAFHVDLGSFADLLNFSL